MRNTQTITLDIDASQPSLDLGTAQETSSENFVLTPLGFQGAHTDQSLFHVSSVMWYQLRA